MFREREYARSRCGATGFARVRESNGMAGSRWTRARAARWADQQPWLVGCNFTPSTASNQLEMWQPETFDPQALARELGWASEIGMNSVRVFLHDLVWQSDADGFKSRIETKLARAIKKNAVRVMDLFRDWDEDRNGVLDWMEASCMTAVVCHRRRSTDAVPSWTAISTY